ncbi:hypothetical protein PMAYCL1PPCAC_14484, partial [Pristionchus mayeri]
FFNCLKDKEPLVADDPTFLHWLFERNLINRGEVCKIFLDMTSKEITLLNDEDRDEVMKKAKELCSWDTAFSERALSIAQGHGGYE